MFFAFPAVEHEHINIPLKLIFVIDLRQHFQQINLDIRFKFPQNEMSLIAPEDN